MKIRFSKRKNSDYKIQDSDIAEEKPDVQDSVAAGDKPKTKAAKFLSARKLRGGKTAGEKPENKESIAAEEKPDVQDSIAAGDKPKTGEAGFFGIFRKLRGRKTAGDKPEFQESIAAEEKPENKESIAAREISESQEVKNIVLIKKKPWTIVKKIIVSVTSVLILALFTLGLFAVSKFIDPLAGIDTIAQHTNTPAPSVQPVTSDGIPVTPTIDPYEKLKAEADLSMLNGIVNILLIGVDHGIERDAATWKGKTAFHSDVMIVLSINTNTKQVSLISLPRDTFAKIPGVNGIYRINASLDCGGGWPKPEAFQKVCDTASWMLCGIPIQYYYAVDFTAVKELVDAVGGVDFNLDIAFKIDGRSYNTGMQHMSGQGALDYMRVRKEKNIVDPTGETGDLKRINRQKAMLVAIFDKMKSTGVIFNLPSILRAFDGNLYTNADISVTAGFAVYAYENIDPKNVKIYSMDGKYSIGLFDLNLVITDVRKRVNIIKEVYGVDITEDKNFSEIYSMYRRWSFERAWSLWYNMQTEVALNKSRGLLDQIKQKLDEDAATPTDPPVEPSPTESTEPSTPPAESSDPSAASIGLSAAASFSYGPKYGDDIRLLYETAENEYTKLKECSENDYSDIRKKLIEQYKTDVQKLCEVVLSISNNEKYWEKFWAVIYNAKNKGECNQGIIRNDIYVDFR